MSELHLSRRTLLTGVAAAAATGGLGALAQAFASGRGASSSHVLVLLELRGGNDGLNTLAPVADPAYRRARPTLALGNDAIALADGLALHPALAPLAPLWRRGRLGFALGVGWPSPRRSHFKAADQWAAGDPSGEGAGWLARAYGSRARSGPLVALDAAGCAATEGGTPLALQLGPAQLRGQSMLVQRSLALEASPVLRQMIALESAGARELEQLRGALAPPPVGLGLPPGGLGRQVELALRLIGSSQCPPVLALAQGGYDTHANQGRRHQRLLNQLALALAGLDAGLQALKQRPAVTLLAVSEFGRRLQENGSGGTDHGSASLALLMGDRIPGPLLGTYPNLNNLDERGDLRPSQSPAQLYRQVLALR